MKRMLLLSQSSSYFSQASNGYFQDTKLAILSRVWLWALSSELEHHTVAWLLSMWLCTAAVMLVCHSPTFRASNAFNTHTSSHFRLGTFHFQIQTRPSPLAVHDPEHAPIHRKSGYQWECVFFFVWPETTNLTEAPAVTWPPPMFICLGWFVMLQCKQRLFPNDCGKIPLVTLERTWLDKRPDPCWICGYKPPP